METLQQINFTYLAIEALRLSAWALMLMFIFLPLERLFPLHKQKIIRKAFFTDLGYFFLSGLLPKLILSLPILLVVSLLHDWVPQWIFMQVASLPLGIRFGLAMVVAEIGTYWGHRWMHEVPFLWRFHAIHHSAEQIDWLVNTRAHPFDLAFPRFCGFILMYIFGLAQPMAGSVDWVASLVIIVGTIWGFFIHSNIRWRFGWLEWFISTPAFHHWHHTLDSPEVINKNYSAMFPWVDRLFGTYHLPKQQWPRLYGIDESMTPNILKQLITPFLFIKK